MKYAKISFIIIIIISFIYYKFNEDNDNFFEDKLSMFILVGSHPNIDDILLDLSSQIESFDEYIYNVYYAKDNDLLIKNKLKSQFDLDYIDYKSLLSSSDIIDFNIRIEKIIEDYFLDHHSSLHLTKKYLLRDFLIRLNEYFEDQIKLFKKQNTLIDLKSPVEDFVLGSKYVSDYRKKYYMIRIEFVDLESAASYRELGMDSIFTSILDYNSKIFGSELIFHNPYTSKLSNSRFDFKLKQYIKKFDSLEDAIAYHKSLMLSDNVFLIESIYDYYFDSSLNNKDSHSLKLNPAILDSNYTIKSNVYKNSLLRLEEKLIALQSDDLTDDFVITDILNNLVGDGELEGLFSNYINTVDSKSNYVLNNINRLFSYELQSLFEEIDQGDNEFSLLSIPVKVEKHLFPSSIFKVRYFVE